MNLLLSNRALPFESSADGLPKRIHIVPRGELFNKDANVTQVLDDAAIASILADLRNRASQGGLYLGEEHFIYDSARSSEAFAWGKTFSTDAKGIWVDDPEYTDVGAAALKNKAPRFKWTSFVADPATPGAIEKLDGNRVRILKIDTVGFTNYANGKALLTPIANRSPLSGASPDSQQTATPKTNMKQIAARFKLSADASEDAILAEVDKLTNRLAALEPHEAENKTLKNRVTELEAEQIDGLLAQHKVTEEKIINRLKPVLANMKNRADRDAFLTECVNVKPETQNAKPGSGRVLNRGEGKTPGTTPAATDEQAVADKILNRARELQKTGLKFEPAWEQARLEEAAA